MAVLAVLSVVIAWRYAIKGKGNGAARLAALLSAVIVVWVLVGFKNPAEAGSLAEEDFVTGIIDILPGLKSGDSSRVH